MRIKVPIRLEYFPVGSPEFDAVEECWRQGKYRILSTYYSTFDFLKDTISYIIIIFGFVVYSLLLTK